MQHHTLFNSTCNAIGTFYVYTTTPKTAIYAIKCSLTAAVLHKAYITHAVLLYSNSNLCNIGKAKLGPNFPNSMQICFYTTPKLRSTQYRCCSTTSGLLILQCRYPKVALLHCLWSFVYRKNQMVRLLYNTGTNKVRINWVYIHHDQ